MTNRRKKSRFRRRKESRRGVALFMVLAIITILGSMAARLNSST